MKTGITDKLLWELYSYLEFAIDKWPENPYPYPSLKALILGHNGSFERKLIKKFGRRKFLHFILYLKRKNYIRIENLKNKKAVSLTKKGFERVIKESFRDKNKIKRKDNRYIMIIFDVPEQKRKLRDLLRSILNNLGYKMFQKSVWITPYDVSEKTEKALQFYSLDVFVKIFLVEEF